MRGNTRAQRTPRLAHAPHRQLGIDGMLLHESLQRQSRTRRSVPPHDANRVFKRPFSPTINLSPSWRSVNRAALQPQPDENSHFAGMVRGAPWSEGADCVARWPFARVQAERDPRGVWQTGVGD
jgi:hypothetical protein